MGIPNSPFLTDLIQYARRIDQKNERPFTSERYLLALTDLLLGNVTFDTTTGFVEILVLISKCCDSIEDTRNELAAYIEREGSDLQKNVAHTERLLERAAIRAKEAGADSLSAVELLRTILEEPTDFLRDTFLRVRDTHHEDTELERMRREL
ncbi:MAG: hypothetical protein J6B77_05605, partial [Clostridia bacterium]|nr:hypothetical protein [Clostridia bacterium]